MSLDASSAAPGRTSTAGVIALRRPGCARRQPGLVGAAGAGELSVAQVERRVGQLAGELAGALVEGVPPASGVPGAESALGPQWNRPCGPSAVPGNRDDTGPAHLAEPQVHDGDGRDCLARPPLPVRDRCLFLHARRPRPSRPGVDGAAVTNGRISSAMRGQSAVVGSSPRRADRRPPEPRFEITTRQRRRHICGDSAPPWGDRRAHVAVADVYPAPRARLIWLNGLDRHLDVPPRHLVHHPPAARRGET
jgi:hypothetical protein